MLFYKLPTLLVFFALLCAGVFGFLPANLAFASDTSGTISGYAWSDKIGWINFGATDGDANITDDGITGYAWNENTGWINFDPAGSGVANTGEGVLSGQAWSEGTGYINFSGVNVNSSGVFSGTATGDNGVNIYFSCDNCGVTTDWRPLSVRSSGTSSGSSTSASNQENVQTSWPSLLLETPLLSVLRELNDQMNDFLKSASNLLKKPSVAVTMPIPKNAPLALSGKFNYLSSRTLTAFALGPLPKDIKLLAQKFPEVQTTFDSVGIKKITDLQKLANTNLKLPGLTETVLSPVKITGGKIAVLKGIAIENLSISAKNNIPSEVVFAKTAAGLVDFNIALSLNSQGKTEQTINTVAGQPLQLVVKADQPAKRVVGYIVFKSKKYKQTSFQLPLDNVATSPLFSAPNFAAALAPSLKVNVEGSEARAEVDPTTVGSTSTDSTVERRLVISYFEYQDTGNGVYAANVQTPPVDAEYEIITVIEYVNESIAPKEIKLITLVDPEGYIYEKNGGQETRIAGAVASIYWLNPETKKYDLWPAHDFQQENPQITDVRGTYSFLVPNGYYYLKVDAPGYKSYESKPFEVKEGSGVHMNIEMKTKYWFLSMFDWKTLLLILVILMLGYNFYKDKKRARLIGG